MPGPPLPLAARWDPPPTHTDRPPSCCTPIPAGSPRRGGVPTRSPGPCARPCPVPAHSPGPPAPLGAARGPAAVAASQAGAALAPPRPEVTQSLRARCYGNSAAASWRGRGAAAPSSDPKWGWKGPGHLEQLGLGCLQTGRLHRILGSCAVLCHPQYNNVLPHVELGLLVVRFRAIAALKGILHSRWRYLCALVRPHLVGKYTKFKIFIF